MKISEGGKMDRQKGKSGLGLMFWGNIVALFAVIPILGVIAALVGGIMELIAIVNLRKQSENYNNAFWFTIIGIVLGLLSSLAGLRYPVIINKTINNIAQTATPVALICIGASFEGKKAIKKIKPTVIATFLKLVGLAAIFLPIAVKMGFRNQELMAILIMLASPSTVTCFVMAKGMDNDEVLSSSIVVLTTLLSSVTLTAWIFILRNFGFI